MTTKQKVASKIVSMAGRFRIMDYFYGPYAKHHRQAVMESITGQKLPVLKCGYNAFRDALNTLFEVQGDCIRNRERYLEGAICLEANNGESNA